MHENPVARKEKLIVQDLSDEILVYDELGHRISYLNPVVAFVWRLCDGQTSTETIARHLETEFGVPSGKEVLSSALQRLHKLSLLEKPIANHARAHAA
jgi:Coenzyme PQQ synthesis protein D (PqqD)